jgi:hypothetical protein
MKSKRIAEVAVADTAAVAEVAMIVAVAAVVILAAAIHVAAGVAVAKISVARKSQAAEAVRLPKSKASERATNSLRGCRS